MPQDLKRLVSRLPDPIHRSRRRTRLMRLAAVIAPSATALVSAWVLWFGDTAPPPGELRCPGILSETSLDSTAGRQPTPLQHVTAAIRNFCSEDKIDNGDTFETVSARHGIQRGEMLAMIEAARPVHNLNRVVAGREVKFTFCDSCLSRTEYEIDEERTLVLTRADSANWRAELEEISYQVVEKELSGTIESSLYQTVVASSGLVELALKLAEIYAWQIDFHNDIRKGDYFKLIYEEKVHPTKSIHKLGEVKAALFRNGEKDCWAIRFENKDGSAGYFDREGISLRRKFLSAPFSYMPRISSGFTHKRFHPILKIYRPHLGIDYAAARGTPVLALGDGRVTKRGWNGGYGKYVEVRHNGAYTTGYGHLSNYGKSLKVGDRVTQGQVIGYVGSTGMSTGPHLDFRFYKNGRAVDPRREDLPAGDPVDRALMDDFVAYSEIVVERLESTHESGAALAGLETGDSRNHGPLLAGGRKFDGLESYIYQD